MFFSALTHWDVATANADMNIGQNWFVASRHLSITWTDVDSHVANFEEVLKIYIRKTSLKETC